MHCSKKKSLRVKNPVCSMKGSMVLNGSNYHVHRSQIFHLSLYNNYVVSSLTVSASWNMISHLWAVCLCSYSSQMESGIVFRQLRCERGDSKWVGAGVSKQTPLLPAAGIQWTQMAPFKLLSHNRKRANYKPLPVSNEEQRHVVFMSRVGQLLLKLWREIIKP